MSELRLKRMCAETPSVSECSGFCGFHSIKQQVGIRLFLAHLIISKAQVGAPCTEGSNLLSCYSKFNSRFKQLLLKAEVAPRSYKPLEAAAAKSRHREWWWPTSPQVLTNYHFRAL